MSLYFLPQLDVLDGSAVPLLRAERLQHFITHLDELRRLAFGRNPVPGRRHNRVLR